MRCLIIKPQALPYEIVAKTFPSILINFGKGRSILTVKTPGNFQSCVNILTPSPHMPSLRCCIMLQSNVLSDIASAVWSPIVVVTSQVVYIIQAYEWNPLMVQKIIYIPGIYFSPDSKVLEANMGPIWGRQDPGGPHVGSMNFAI